MSRRRSISRRAPNERASEGTAPRPGGGALSGLGDAFRRLASSTSGPVFIVLIVVFVACVIAVSIDSDSSTSEFLSVDNIRDMLVRSVALGIVAAGQTLVILGASLDLSVGWVVGLGSILAAETMNGQDSRIILGILVVLLFGAGVGLVNGLVITKLRVNAFIATLGMALILRGYVEANYAGPVTGVPEGFQKLGFESWGPIPISVVLLLAVVAGAWFLLRYSRFGNRLYAVGGDEDVAKLSGVRTHRVIIMAHVLCALAAAITGLFIASRLGAGSPTIAIEGGYDLESIAAVVLGGTYLLGGRGGVLGTLAGVFILALLDSTFNQLEVDAFLKDVARGVIIIAAVAAYSVRWTRRRREEAQAATGQTPGPEPARGGRRHEHRRRHPAPEPPAGVGRAPGVARAPAVAALRAIPVVWILLIVVFVWISFEDQNFLTPEGFLAYLKTSAPLAILAIGAYFVLASGEFDLSVGSLVTVIAVVAAKQIDGDPANTVPTIVLLFGDRRCGGPLQRLRHHDPPRPVVHRHPRNAPHPERGGVPLDRRCAPSATSPTTSARSAARGSRASPSSRRSRTPRSS